MAVGISARTRSLLSGVAVGTVVGLLAAKASKDIVLIDIDESDIEDAENNFDVIWPWPRSLYGDITTYCKKAGAKAVVFDWLFQDRGRSEERRVGKECR